MNLLMDLIKLESTVRLWRTWIVCKNLNMFFILREIVEANNNGELSNYVFFRLTFLREINLFFEADVNNLEVYFSWNQDFFQWLSSRRVAVLTKHCREIFVMRYFFRQTNLEKLTSKRYFDGNFATKSGSKSKTFWRNFFVKIVLLSIFKRFDEKFMLAFSFFYETFHHHRSMVILWWLN